MVKTLFYWPNLNKFNPYQSILYSEINEYRVFDELPWLTTSGFIKTECVFHLHWEHWVYRNSREDDEVTLKIYEFLSNLVKFISEGGRFIWTIHNELPHENIWPQYSRVLQESLASLAHAIIVHSNSALSKYSKKFPGYTKKIFVIRHPSYRKYFYKIKHLPISGITKSKETTFLFLGQARKYKRLDFLLDCLSYQSLQKIPWRLIIAGDGPINEYVKKFYSGDLSRLVTIDRRVTDGEIKFLAGTADFGVFTFKEILSSGSIKLLSDLDLPVIAPRIPTLLEESYSSGVVWYSLGDKESLVTTLEKVARSHFDDSESVTWKHTCENTTTYANHELLNVFETLKLKTTSAPVNPRLKDHFGAVIACWPGQERGALEIQSEISKCGLSCYVIFSESSQNEGLTHTPKGWIKIPDDWYYGRKLQFALDFFDFDTVLHIQADTRYSNWGNLITRLVKAFTEPKSFKLGIWAPDLDYTFWQSPAVDVGFDKFSGLTFVTQTDTTCWALSRQVQDFLRKTPLISNNPGWGVDLASVSFCYMSGLAVCRDRALKVEHPKGSNYDRLNAQETEARFLKSLPLGLQLHVHILNSFSRARIAELNRRRSNGEVKTTCEAQTSKRPQQS